MKDLFLTTKRIIIWIITILLETILGLMFQTKIKTMSIFIRDYFLELFLALLVFTSLIFILYFFVIYLIRSIKYMRVKLKYYDIMLTKFHDKNQSSAFNVFPEDTKLFTKEELKTLNIYMKNLEQLKIQMKGRNKVGGMFL